MILSHFHNVVLDQHDHDPHDVIYLLILGAKLETNQYLSVQRVKFIKAKVLCRYIVAVIKVIKVLLLDVKC